MPLPRPVHRTIALLAAPALLAAGLAACGSGEAEQPAAPRTGTDLALVSSDLERSAGDATAVEDTVTSLHHLAGNLYGELAASEGNLALSPYSVAVALAMTANGANGATAEEMLDVLGTDDLTRFNGGLNALSQYVEGLAGQQERADGSEAEIALDTANALFGHHETAWNTEFLDTLAREYGAGMRTVDYVAATEEARRLINGWTAEQTRDRIPEIIPPDVLDELTRLVLVNALYLKAPWEEPFEPDLTEARPFHLDDGTTVDVDTMTDKMDLARHGTGDGWEAAQLPYAGGDLAMTLILPDEGRLADVEARVSSGDLDGFLEPLIPLMVELSLPRWTFRSTSPLKDTLAAVGMPTAFSDDADFLGMTSPEAPVELSIQDVLHETFIAVDEEGTEAAAATAVVMKQTSAPTYEPVVVDRPFLFVIHDVQHDTPLFLGRVTDPSRD